MSSVKGIKISGLQCTCLTSLVTELPKFTNLLRWIINRSPTLENSCSKEAGCSDEQILQKYKSFPCSSSDFKEVLIACWMELETGNCKILQGSSRMLLWKQEWQVIEFLMAILTWSRAEWETLQISSKMQERISEASCCWKMLNSAFNQSLP